MTRQLLLDGTAADDPIIFNCPICDKLIILDCDEKSIWHRPWTFHLIYDHKDAIMGVKFKGAAFLFLMNYYMIHDDVDCNIQIQMELGMIK